MARVMSVRTLLLMLGSLSISACGTATDSTVSDASVAAPKFATPFDRPPADCLKLTPTTETFSADPMGLATGFAPRSIEIAFAVDESFVEVWGDEWLAVAEDLVAEMQAVFSRDVQLDIVPVFIEAMTGFDIRDYPNAGPDNIMQASIDAFEERYAGLERESVQFFLGADVAGTVAGQANCIGGAGHPDVAYVWGEAYNREPFDFGVADVLRDMAAKVAIHELGHMLSAHHHYTQCRGESVSTEDAAAACGVMINDIGFAGWHFSEANRLAMRGWADSQDL